MQAMMVAAPSPAPTIGGMPVSSYGLTRGNNSSNNNNGTSTRWRMMASAGRGPEPLQRGPRANAASLFVQEEIGAEYGEGFSGYRPRGPLHVDVDFLNDRMRERGLQRIRNALKPDQAFGLVFSWDNVLADTKTARLRAWQKLADEEGRILTNDPQKRKLLLCSSAEQVFDKVLHWARDGEEASRLMNRLASFYCQELHKVEAPIAGSREWLEAIYASGIPCALSSNLDRATLLCALNKMRLTKYFQAFVTQEDGMDSIAHRFLSAAVKLDRPPSKCIVFEDDPRGIAAAHNCTMKAVALIGPHPAYELTQADLAVSSFAELSVINLRRLFANKGSEFMDLQKQSAERIPSGRKLTIDTSI